MAGQLREYAGHTIGKNRQFKQSPVLVRLKNRRSAGLRPERQDDGGKQAASGRSA